MSRSQNDNKEHMSKNGSWQLAGARQPFRRAPGASVRGKLRTSENSLRQVRIHLEDPTHVSCGRAASLSLPSGARIPGWATRRCSFLSAPTYAILAYVLENREEVERYIARRRSEAEQLRTEIERRFSPAGIRGRLLARRSAGEPRSK